MTGPLAPCLFLLASGLMLSGCQNRASTLTVSGTLIVITHVQGAGCRVERGGQRLEVSRASGEGQADVDVPSRSGEGEARGEAGLNVAGLLASISECASVPRATE